MPLDSPTEPDLTTAVEDAAPRRPKLGRLALAGAVLLVAAGVVVANGISNRARSDAKLATWAGSQATPTVAVVRPDASAAARQVTLPGTIQAFSSAPIYSRVSGYVAGWHADIGARVTKGQILADIDTPDLDQQFVQAQANLASAAENERMAALTASRWHQLLGTQAVSPQAENEKASDALSKHAIMQAAKANVGQLEAMERFKHIVAPFDGVVTARRTDIGELVSANTVSGAALFQISDVHKVRIYVPIPQAFAAELRPGLKASLSIPQYADRIFEATLVSTANAFAEASRTVQVELQADNPDGKLWPGTFTEVTFQLPAAANVLRVSATALIFDAQGTHVAVLGPDNKVTMRPVKLGRNLGNDAEIVGGLNPSDRVVDSPPEWLSTGDTVRVAANDTQAPQDPAAK